MGFTKIGDPFVSPLLPPPPFPLSLSLPLSLPLSSPCIGPTRFESPIPAQTPLDAPSSSPATSSAHYRSNYEQYVCVYLAHESLVFSNHFSGFCGRPLLLNGTRCSDLPAGPGKDVLEAILLFSAFNDRLCYQQKTSLCRIYRYHTSAYVLLYSRPKCERITPRETIFHTLSPRRRNKQRGLDAK